MEVKRCDSNRNTRKLSPERNDFQQYIFKCFSVVLGISTRSLVTILATRIYCSNGKTDPLQRLVNCQEETIVFMYLSEGFIYFSKYYTLYPQFGFVKKFFNRKKEPKCWKSISVGIPFPGQTEQVSCILGKTKQLQINYNMQKQLHTYCTPPPIL